MTDLAVPQDLEAEAAVVGAVVATHLAVPHIVDVVCRADFYDPALGRAFAAAVDLGSLNLSAVRPPAPRVVRLGAGLADLPWAISTENVRTGAVSVLADVELGRLRQLVAARPATNTRSWALRVVDAARRRRAMAAFADAYSALGHGEGLDEAVALLAGIPA